MRAQKVTVNILRQICPMLMTKNYHASQLSNQTSPPMLDLAAAKSQLASKN